MLLAVPFSAIDDVVRNAGEMLGGKTVIGERSTIGANVFLRESVPPDSFVTNDGEKLNLFNKITGESVAPAESGSEI